MKRITLLLICSLLMFAQTNARKKNQNAQIPILAWFSIPPGSFATEERYQELRDCGFTYSFSHIYSMDDAVKALDLCAKVGMKSVFMAPELETKPEETVNKVKNHKGLGAYFLRDEPGNDSFEALGKWARRIESADKKHPCYLNLLPVHAFPQGGYDEHNTDHQGDLELGCGKEEQFHECEEDEECGEQVALVQHRQRRTDDDQEY